jgi:hypothetical protein
MENSDQAKLNWQKAKRETARLLADLPEYTDDMILTEYAELLESLQGDDIKHLPGRQKAFEMHKRYPRFAVAYSSLLMLACHRAAPVPVAMVEKLLETAKLQKAGVVSEGVGRGMAMDLAEGYRRNVKDDGAGGGL